MKPVKKFFSAALLSGVLLTASTLASADTNVLSALVNAINRLATATGASTKYLQDIDAIVNYWKKLFNEMVQTNAKMIYEAIPYMGTTIAANQALQENGQADSTLENAVTTNVNDALKTLTTTVSSSTLITKLTDLVPNTSEADRSPLALSFSNLMDPFQYDQTQQTAADSFMTFIAQLASPPTAVDKSIVDKVASGRGDTQFALYQYAMGSFAALQSVATGNLYRIYQERVPQPGLGTKAGIGTSNASPLQVKQYEASWRADSPSWYEQMQVMKLSAVT